MSFMMVLSIIHTDMKVINKIYFHSHNYRNNHKAMREQIHYDIHYPVYVQHMNIQPTFKCP